MIDSKKNPLTAFRRPFGAGGTFTFYAFRHGNFANKNYL